MAPLDRFMPAFDANEIHSRSRTTRPPETVGTLHLKRCAEAVRPALDELRGGRLPGVPDRRFRPRDDAVSIPARASSGTDQGGHVVELRIGAWCEGVVLEQAIEDAAGVVGLTIRERTAVLDVLDKPPPGPEELRAVRVQEHTARMRDAIV